MKTDAAAHWLQIHGDDTVAVALQPLPKGTQASGNGWACTLSDDIPRGHKFAFTAIHQNENVIKYGSPIGRATTLIPAGAWVHTHNLRTGLKPDGKYEYAPEHIPAAAAEPAVFSGFKRRNGKIGIRNELWILPTVGCINGFAESLAREAIQLVGTDIDGIFAFPHPYGCSQLGGDLEYTVRLISRLAEHPNAGGVLIVGLGCENAGISVIKNELDEKACSAIRFLNVQDCNDELEEGLRLIGELTEEASSCKREDLPSSELIVGLKCGGSDGLSGITANPLLGKLTEKLTAAGGTALLTEVPEMFGAETILMNRCTDETVFAQTVELIQTHKRYFTDAGQPVYENPSPGNKEGGITTLEEKSLGCIQKAGRVPVSGVIPYGKAAASKGLLLVDAPGNDLVASTALAAAGAHLILFTTGRGTPFGSPVPTLKISSNTPLYEKKPHWIDFDAGIIAAGTDAGILCGKLMELVIESASGRKTLAEQHGYRDMAIFKRGVTL